MIPNVHVLKTWPEAFEAVRRGDKTAEFRRNDRDFQLGDMLILVEYCPVQQKETGHELLRTISHMVEGPAFGIPEGFTMLSFRTIGARMGLPSTSEILGGGALSPSAELKLAIEHDVFPGDVYQKLHVRGTVRYFVWELPDVSGEVTLRCMVEDDKVTTSVAALKTDYRLLRRNPNSRSSRGVRVG